MQSSELAKYIGKRCKIFHRISPSQRYQYNAIVTAIDSTHIHFEDIGDHNKTKSFLINEINIEAQ